jgi:hypothetical protein
MYYHLSRSLNHLVHTELWGGCYHRIIVVKILATLLLLSYPCLVGRWDAEIVKLRRPFSGTCRSEEAYDWYLKEDFDYVLVGAFFSTGQTVLLKKVFLGKLDFFFFSKLSARLASL